MVDVRDPIDGDSFETALHEVVERAHDNGVDVEGAWKISTTANGGSHWGLQIVPVEYDEE